MSARLDHASDAFLNIQISSTLRYFAKPDPACRAEGLFDPLEPPEPAQPGEGNLLTLTQVTVVSSILSHSPH